MFGFRRRKRRRRRLNTFANRTNQQINSLLATAHEKDKIILKQSKELYELKKHSDKINQVLSEIYTTWKTLRKKHISYKEKFNKIGEVIDGIDLTFPEEEG